MPRGRGAAGARPIRSRERRGGGSTAQWRRVRGRVPPPGIGGGGGGRAVGRSVAEQRTQAGEGRALVAAARQSVRGSGDRHRAAPWGDVRAAATGPAARPRPRSLRLPSLAPSLRQRRRLPPASAAGPRVMS